MTTIYQSVGLRGEFELHALNPNTGETRFLHEQKNLITNYGMDDIGTTSQGASSFWQYCHVGTGSTPPAFTDVALAAERAVVAGGPNPPEFDRSWDGYSAVWTRRCVFATGAASGNLTEIGMSQTAAGSLCTRALFTDSGGNPVTITVLADEQLIVIYRLVWVINTQDQVFTTTTGPGSIEYTLTLRPARLGSEHGNSIGVGAITSPYNHFLYHGTASALGPITGGPSGTSMSASNGSHQRAPYVPGSYQRSETYTFTPSMGNATDIGAVLFSGHPVRYQLGIVPRITKTSTQTLAITVVNQWSRG